jgi:hypothetical protein
MPHGRSKRSPATSSARRYDEIGVRELHAGERRNPFRRDNEETIDRQRHTGQGRDVVVVERQRRRRGRDRAAPVHERVDARRLEVRRRERADGGEAERAGADGERFRVLDRVAADVRHDREAVRLRRRRPGVVQRQPLGAGERVALARRSGDEHRLQPLRRQERGLRRDDRRRDGSVRVERREDCGDELVEWT